MTENTAFAMGWVSGLFMGMGLMKIAWEHEQRLTRRRPYSSAAIAFRATAEDAAKVRSKIVNPLAWEDPPEQFIRMDEGSVQRGNGNGGPCAAGPEHCDCGALWRDVPIKPQPPSGRVVDAYGRTIGYIPRSQGGTPNPPPTDP